VFGFHHSSLRLRQQRGLATARLSRSIRRRWTDQARPSNFTDLRSVLVPAPGYLELIIKDIARGFPLPSVASFSLLLH
jgi:hypothetical protein